VRSESAHDGFESCDGGSAKRERSPVPGTRSIRRPQKFRTADKRKKIVGRMTALRGLYPSETREGERSARKHLPTTGKMLKRFSKADAFEVREGAVQGSSQRKYNSRKSPTFSSQLASWRRPSRIRDRTRKESLNRCNASRYNPGPCIVWRGRPQTAIRSNFAISLCRSSSCTEGKR